MKLQKNNCFPAVSLRTTLERSQSPTWTANRTARRILSLPLIAWLGLLGGGWLVQDAIAPQPAQAYTARVDLAMEKRETDTYETLLRRAESVARAAAQRSFDQDILVTEVSITITAQGEGATVPLLTLDVSRANWRKRPDAQYWATYFRGARTFLQFDQLGGGSPSTQPAVAPVLTPPIPASNGSLNSNPSQPTSIPQNSPIIQPPPGSATPTQSTPAPPTTTSDPLRSSDQAAPSQ